MDTTKFIDHLARTPLSEILVFSLVLSVVRVGLFFMLSTKTSTPKSGLRRFAQGGSELLDSLIYAAIFIFMVIRPFFFQTFQIPSGSMIPTCMIGDYIGLNKAIYRYTDPKRGDIVVFRPPADACRPDQLDEDGTVNTDFVKRLIGLPGELVEIKKGEVFINGKRLWEPYKHYTKVLNPQMTEFRVLDRVESQLFPKPDWKLIDFKGRLIPLNYTEMDANRLGAMYDVSPKYALENPIEWNDARRQPAQRIPAGYYLFMGDNRNGSFDGRGWGLIHRSAIVGRAEFVWLPFSRMGKLRHVDNGDPRQEGDEVDEFLK